MMVVLIVAVNTLPNNIDIHQEWNAFKVRLNC